MSEFLLQSLASTSPSSPVVRVKDVFILGAYFRSTEAGLRDPAFSIQVATNTDHVNRILVDVKVSPQSVSFRSLHLSSKYTVEEDEEPLRCVILPSLKVALIKSYHERPPLESSKTCWADFVDFFERHHKLHLPDEVEERGYATVIVNNSSDPNRFSSPMEDVVPVATLWTESGLSRRDLHGESGDILSRYIVSTIASIESLSVKPTATVIKEGEEGAHSVVEEKSLVFIPLSPESFADVLTTKTGEIIERCKESRAKMSGGFTKSSKRSSSSQQDREEGLDVSNSSTDASSQPTRPSSSVTSSLLSELDASQTFTHTMFDLEPIQHPTSLESVLQALHSPSSSASALGNSQSASKASPNKPLQFRANVRLGARLAPGRTNHALAHAPFTPIAHSHSISTSTPSAITSKSNNSEKGAQHSTTTTQSNFKKRKVSTSSPHQSPMKAFQPPRQKLPKA